MGDRRPAERELHEGSILRLLETRPLTTDEVAEDLQISERYAALILCGMRDAGQTRRQLTEHMKPNRLGWALAM